MFFFKEEKSDTLMEKVKLCEIRLSCAWSLEYSHSSDEDSFGKLGFAEDHYVDLEVHPLLKEKARSEHPLKP